MGIPSGSLGDTGAALRDRVSAAWSASDHGRTGTIADNMMPVVGGELHGANVDHTRSRTQIIPIYVIGAGSDEIGEAVQSGGSGVALKTFGSGIP